MLFLIQRVDCVPMLFEVLSEYRVNITTDGNALLGGEDIYDFGNLAVNLPADIDALARFDLVAFEIPAPVVGGFCFRQLLEWRPEIISFAHDYPFYIR